MKNDIEIILKMKFEKIGKFFIKDKNFIVELDEKYSFLTNSIYIHTIGNEVVRVGSSKGKLGSRMKGWERDVSKSLKGEKSSSPHWESQKWDKLLKNKTGILYGRQGTITKTPLGEINTYLSEESYLIPLFGYRNGKDNTDGKRKNNMNRSMHR